MFHWKTLLRARAIENLSYVVAFNRVGEDDNALVYTGSSTILGPDGMSLVEESEESKILIAEISKSKLESYRQTFAFADDADAFEINP